MRRRTGYVTHLVSLQAGISRIFLADLLGINVGRVNHHLRNLSRSGVVYRQRRRVHLRGRSMRESVQELRRDADRIFDELEKVATDIDRMMGLPGLKDQASPSRALIRRPDSD